MGRILTVLALTLLGACEAGEDEGSGGGAVVKILDEASYSASWACVSNCGEMPFADYRSAYFTEISPGTFSFRLAGGNSYAQANCSRSSGALICQALRNGTITSLGGFTIEERPGAATARIGYRRTSGVAEYQDLRMTPAVCDPTEGACP